MEVVSSLRDPRAASVEQRTETPNQENNQTTRSEQPVQSSDEMLRQAIPAAGTTEHAEYVKALLNRIQQLEQAGATSTSGLPRTLGLRVSPKGAVSVYGVNANFPVTLYPEQWKRLFEPENSKRILDFVEANKDLLEFKEEPDDIRNKKGETRTKMGIVARNPQRRAA